MRFLSILVASAALAVAMPAAKAADPIVIKFSHVVAENTPKGRMATKFKEIVDEKLGGKVVVEVYPNSQLYGDNKVLEAMLLGDVHLAAPALSKFESYTGKFQLFDLPFLFKDIEAVDRFQQGEVGQGLLTSMERKGITGLGYLHNGMKQLSASRPVRVPDDVSGMKFRIMTSDVLAAQFQAVDALPVKKPFSEVFTLLQTKAIDGQENTYSNIFSQKFYEVQPYITETNHGLLDYLVVTSTEFWTDLPEDIRGDVRAALNEALAYGNDIANQLNTEQRQLILDSNRSEIILLTDAERQLWVDAMKPVWAEFEKDIGKDLIDAAAASNAAS